MESGGRAARPAHHRADPEPGRGYLSLAEILALKVDGRHHHGACAAGPGCKSCRMARSGSALRPARWARLCCAATKWRHAPSLCVWRVCSRTVFISSCNAPAVPTTKPMSAPLWRWRPTSSWCRWPPQPGAVQQAERFLNRTKLGFALPRAKTLGNKKASSASRQDHNFKSAAEMEALLADVPSALANTVEIAKRGSAHLKLGTHFLPDFHAQRHADCRVFPPRLVRGPGGVPGAAVPECGQARCGASQVMWSGWSLSWASS